MKEYNIQTRMGQFHLLKDMIELEKLGYEKGEENLKHYNEGYMQALKDILGMTQLKFTINGKYYYNTED